GNDRKEREYSSSLPASAGMTAGSGFPLSQADLRIAPSKNKLLLPAPLKRKLDFQHRGNDRGSRQRKIWHRSV
ncbi:MAG TPA: hypothetical protein PLB96_13190, partial [Syntrophales bacterium]|nr:hypothetical protein [Syntrophales bacterium]